MLAALSMVGVLGFGAVVVDAGAIYAERRQLQNGSDAAALAVAMQCAAGDCGDTATAAAELADANANDGAASVQQIEILENRVIVSTATETADGGSGVTHWIAPLLGIDETAVNAGAAADWGGPSAGTSILPLAISWCSFFEHTGGGVPSDEIEQTIFYLAEGASDCVGPSGAAIPGGFGWLEPDPATCAASSSIATAAPGKPGVSTPTECEPVDFDAIRDETVLLPIYQDAGGEGSSGWFDIHAYAAFHITGYRFACPPGYRWNDGAGACGSNSERFITGYFTEFVTLDGAWKFGGPDVGGRVVRLTQ